MTTRKTTPAIRGTLPEIERRARELRDNMTPMEQRLWHALRGKQVDGLRFRAQHPVGRFILDFYCPALRLVIEVDGESHNSQVGRDDERTAFLAEYGYHVIRFRNDEIETDLPETLQRIRDAAAQCQQNTKDTPRTHDQS